MHVIYASAVQSVRSSLYAVHTTLVGTHSVGTVLSVQSGQQAHLSTPRLGCRRGPCNNVTKTSMPLTRFLPLFLALSQCVFRTCVCVCVCVCGVRFLYFALGAYYESKLSLSLFQTPAFLFSPPPT